MFLLDLIFGPCDLKVTTPCPTSMRKEGCGAASWSVREHLHRVRLRPESFICYLIYSSPQPCEQAAVVILISQMNKLRPGDQSTQKDNTVGEWLS